MSRSNKPNGIGHVIPPQGGTGGVRPAVGRPARPTYDRLWVADGELIVRLNACAADGWRVLSAHPGRRPSPLGEVSGWDVLLERHG